MPDEAPSPNPLIDMKETTKESTKEKDEVNVIAMDEDVSSYACRDDTEHKIY